jgi:two-component system, OmpR family, sensor histidine kinase TctE
LKVDQWHRLSLRRTLLLVLVPAMMLVVAGELWLTWRTAVEATNAAYDRSLLGAIKSIDANISTESGGVGIELPYRMLEFFQLTADGQVYYRVATEDGLVEIGDGNFPPPLRELETGKPQFHDTEYFSRPVRVGSYARVLNPPVGGQGSGQRVVIQVAETLGSREQFTRSLVLQAAARDLFLVLVAGVLLAGAISWALRPLSRLRNEVKTRSPQDLTPIETAGVPVDVEPLVEAINAHVDRTRQLTEAQRRFIDDASHQMRTPLTTLTTQVGFALREADPERLRGALQAIRSQLEETVRLANQMLALGRADAAEMALVPVDLCALAEAVARGIWNDAQAKSIDLGLDTPGEPVLVSAHPELLKEALSNLLHNAIRYTPVEGRVTVSVGRGADEVRLTVSDNGPGIPKDEYHRIGQRFFRASNVQQAGSGLGLAIVESIATRHGGRLESASGPEGEGLSITLVLPRR